MHAAAHLGRLNACLNPVYALSRAAMFSLSLSPSRSLSVDARNSPESKMVIAAEGISKLACHNNINGGPPRQSTRLLAELSCVHENLRSAHMDPKDPIRPSPAVHSRLPNAPYSPNFGTIRRNTKGRIPKECGQTFLI